MLLFSHISDTLFLIALCMGYVVLYFAKREEKGMQFLGYLIGCLAIILTTIYLLTNLWIGRMIHCPTKAGVYKGKMQQRMMHPKTAPQVPGQQQVP